MKVIQHPDLSLVIVATAALLLVFLMMLLFPLAEQILEQGNQFLSEMLTACENKIKSVHGLY